jgi:nitrous-oxide reductase
MNTMRFIFLPIILLAIGIGFILHGCGGGGEKKGTGSDVADNALKVYVAPGDMDEYYAFLSGGHGGNVYVYGVPSMRHLRTIPVFQAYAATGYGFDVESRALMGEFDWGDVHHPAPSETKGDYDGRWIFVNDNANNRLARIDLTTFRTAEVFGPIPNLSGDHGSAYVTPNTEYSLIASRFSIPIPKGSFEKIEDYATKYKGVIAGVKIDPQNGHMSYGFEVLMPPFNYDLGDAGKGPSEGWAFWTCYNSERATGVLEVNASQRDMDYIAVLNWKEAEKAIKDPAKTMNIGGVPVIDPKKAPGLLYLMPCGKSPHGVDVTPDGKYIVGNGKLSPIVTIFSFEKIQKAIADKKFTGDEDGIPILPYESVKEAEVTVGLGPLHTQFDDKGYAYTSLFVESSIAKWSVGVGGKWELVDKIPVSYNVGHLVSSHGETMHPDGKWLISMNKLSKGTHLPLGPDLPECAELIDISGEKMKLIYQAFPEPEPHYGVMIKADLIAPKVKELFTKEDNKNPNAIWDPKDARVERKGNTTEVWMTLIRSTITPTAIEVTEGDRVLIHLTNIEEMRDEIHGFGICEYNINSDLFPGETKTLDFSAKKSGVWPFYCTNFCSALHQEMQGYLLVKPKGAPHPENTPPNKIRHAVLADE